MTVYYDIEWGGMVAHYAGQSRDKIKAHAARVLEEYWDTTFGDAIKTMKVTRCDPCRVMCREIREEGWE